MTPHTDGPADDAEAGPAVHTRAASRAGSRRAASGSAWWAHFNGWTVPRSDGLPNARVVWWFPALLSLAVGLLTTLNVNGSSTGTFRSLFYSSSDPDLIAGRLRPIRTDEWLVQSSWVASQVSEGFPRRNRVFPGGMDATLMNDLPTWDWSGVFRPHTWGFLALGLDHGMAIRWWLPAALMMSAAYFFVVTILPRRPLVAAALASAVMFQPDIQWWWLPITPNPLAFAFVAMAATMWGYRSGSRWGRLLPAAAAGYLAVDMAMGIYVPFMIPAVLAVAAFGVGFVLQEWRTRALRLREVVTGVLPLAIAGVGSAAVLAAWLGTRRDAVAATLGTVYPGQRVTPPGSGGEADAVSLLSGPFQRWLLFHDAPSPIGGNQSEASAPLLVSLYLVVPLLWVIWAQWRRQRHVDWTIVAIMAVQLVVLAFLYLPGWEGVAGVLGLDRAVPQRIRLLFVILGVVAVALLVDRLTDLGLRGPWSAALVAGATVLISGAWVWHHVGRPDGDSLRSAAAVVVLVVLTVGVVMVARGRAGLGSALLLGCALAVGSGVNPINRGVFDLRTDTEAGRAVVELNHQHPDARWVGVGSNLSVSTLVQAGVPAYSGVQTYPAGTMWAQLDPDRSHELAWNRLASVFWVAGSGDPDPRQPPGGNDQVELTFDSCSAFAQQYVTYALVDGPRLEQDCLKPLRKIRQGHVHQWIYQVVRAPG